MHIEVESLEAEEVLEKVSAHVGIPEPQLPIETKLPPTPFPDSFDIAKGESLPDQKAVTTAEVLDQVRSVIRTCAASSERAEITPENHKLLRKLCRNERWREVRELSANLVFQEAKSEGWLSSVESLFCVAAVENYGSASRPDAQEQLAALCLGIIASLIIDHPTESYYYTDRQRMRSRLVAAFLAGVSGSPESAKDNSDQRHAVAEVLGRLADVPPSDAGHRWASKLLTEARSLRHPDKNRNGSSVLAAVLWDSLTGHADPAQGRAKLLLLGFRMNLVDDFVAYLAKEYAAPHDYHVLEFMRAVRSAEANESAWNDASRLAQSFVEQVPPKSLKPWRLVVDELNRQHKSDAPSDICNLSLEDYSRKNETTFLLTLCVIPDRYSVIEVANLEIGDSTTDEVLPLQAYQLVEEDGLIPSPRIVRVEVKVSPGQMAADTIVFPFKLSVRNTNAQQSESRDRWTLQLKKTQLDPMPQEMVSRCWKGAEGNPVDTSLQAYYGRQTEHAKIQELLSGNDGRQRSAVVIGQRRIGKTSLLVEMLRQYPPKEGHVCGVFCQFGGMQKKSPDEPLARTIFNALTECTDVTGYNAAFCDLLSERLGSAWGRKLRSGLNPATSIAAALTTFVERVAEATKGRVQRMTFFADEFQDVFKYDAEEVDKVMWGLRPLVQMSPQVSLILAGSGLTRSLTQSYSRALFGSISEIHLRPFCLADDFESVAKTLLPMESRKWLCPDEKKLQAIVESAYRLTGGHPWFLSMLGSSAAQMLQGRPLTPPILNEVATGMITGRISSHDGEIGASRFYGHMFDSLDACGKLKYHAQLVLSNIARQVTFEWPWLTATQAITGSRIAQAELSQRECLDALKTLRDEDVLEHKLEGKGPRYKIRIPLVAKAVSYDADDIEYLALQELSD
jgi:hypothetical protein